MKQIVVDCRNDGKIEVEGKGFIGDECFAEMKFLEDALGTVTDQRDTQERTRRSAICKRQKIGR